MRHAIAQRHMSNLTAVVVATLLASSCGDQYEAAARQPEARSMRVGAIIDFHEPESVKYDPDQDVYFVSNINGFGSVKDNNGYISRVNASNINDIQTLVQGGAHGVTLHAPKGMAIHGDTLWVCDIDALRGFDRHGGSPLATIDFAPYGAVLLNDIAVGPDGSLHVTDTGIQMTEKGVIFSGGDKLFVVGPNHSVKVQESGAQLDKPNGITWDAKGKRWLYVSFDPFHSRLFAMHDGDTTRAVLDSGHGKWDGVEALADGRILVSSWTDSTVHLIADGHDERLVRNVPVPADIGVDTKRGLVLVPLGIFSRVELWTIPAANR
ncbi:MAG: SMP-30/gluconolactonase/LRE family protein [Gemmatimonadaceae bacterium]